MKTFLHVLSLLGIVLVLVLMLAVLELNQNRVLGLVLCLALFAGYLFLRHRLLAQGAPFPWRLACFAGWLALYAGLLFCTWPPVQPVPAVPQKDPAKTSVVTLPQGQLQGVLTQDAAVEVYAGIPYAQPPVGDLRWREPQDPLPWEGVLQADHFGPMSMQPTHTPLYDSLYRMLGYHDYRPSLSDNYVPPVSEDSLYLNLWKPAGAQSGLPVLVYVHGGSLKTGRTWYGDFNGQGLAHEGVLVVNFAYRLGVFGYLADPELAAESPHGSTGNYGLLDQIKALEWVHQNIAAFGGDPDNVTVAGESAGAASVSALCTSPLARGLFRRAILESSTLAPVAPTHSFRLLDEALASGAALKQRHQAADVAALRALPAEKLVAEAETQHHITVDGYALTETPYDSYRRGVHNEEALLHGYNSRESGPFVLFDQADLKNYETKVRDYFGAVSDDVLALYPAADDRQARDNWAEIFGAVFFDYPHYCLNRLAGEIGIPAYEYYFSKGNGSIGPWHSGEMIYCYGSIPASSRLFDGRDRELSAQMLSYWANFCRTGDPNGEGLPLWERNTASGRVMRFGDETVMTDEGEHELFAVFDRVTGFER